MLVADLNEPFQGIGFILLNLAGDSRLVCIELAVVGHHFDDVGMAAVSVWQLHRLHKSGGLRNNALT